MNSILERLLNTLEEGFSIIRLTILEDENYGKAIIQRPDGTPQTWLYDKDKGIWS